MGHCLFAKIRIGAVLCPMGQGRSPVYNTRAMQHQSLFVFDIETMPDTDAVPSLTGFDDPDVAARR